MWIILVVLFCCTMFLWLLAMLGAVFLAAGGAVRDPPAYSPWLAFFACLFLGIAVFLVGGGLPR